MFSEMLRELDEIASASSASPSCSIHSRVFILQRASAASTDTVRLLRLFRPERRADQYTAGKSADDIAEYKPEFAPTDESALVLPPWPSSQLNCPSQTPSPLSLTSTRSAQSYTGLQRRIS